MYQLRLSCDAQLGCVKLSDCVPKRLRRKAVFNSSRKRLRPNSGWNADAQARLRLNSCRKTQLRLSCDAQLGCVKLSDCVPKRLRRKAASGAIAFEPRLERNHPFANVRRSLRRNHG